MSGRELKEACPGLAWSRLRGFLLRLFEAGVIVQIDADDTNRRAGSPPAG